METDQPVIPQEDTDITAYHDHIRDSELMQFEAGVKKARNALFWAGGLIFLGEMIAMARAQNGFDPYIFGIAVVEAGIFIALGLWTKKKPYTAIVTGLIAFILIMIFATVVAGMLQGAEAAGRILAGGIVVKILIVVALVRPIKNARELQRAKEESK